MTVDGVVEVIAFIVGGLVLAWGFRSLAFASSGGDRSGLHELGRASVAATGGSEDVPEPEEAAEVVVKSARTQRFHQAANYVLSLAAMGALAAMLIGAYLA